MLIREAREDAQFRKDLALTMQESTSRFNESIKMSVKLWFLWVLSKRIATYPQEDEGIYTPLLGPQNQQDPGSNVKFYYRL